MTTQYSYADVKKHNDNQSTWIVIHNNIYDVTAFLNEYVIISLGAVYFLFVLHIRRIIFYHDYVSLKHPGGEEVLLEQAGKDGSEAFEDVGHSSDARELMKKYKIGEIVESEKKPVKEKNVDWTNSSSPSSSSQSSFKSWILPVTLGLLATIIYRIYFQSH